MQTEPPSWEDVAWMRGEWGGPFMLKGVCRVDDARKAVDAGVTAISVSNHGGNNIDGTPAPIRALPAVANAVGDQIEVVLDVLRGGIDSALLGLNHSSIHDLGPDDVLAPDGFFRTLGP